MALFAPSYPFADARRMTNEGGEEPSIASNALRSAPHYAPAMVWEGVRCEHTHAQTRNMNERKISL